ncbi:MAG: hypothetical protein ACK4GW_15030 [Pseudorhodobacter sp.]
MGNRGILHDAEQSVLRTHAHQNWVTCALSFKGRRREIMAPGHYTELFFLDEATALAAGHRPCAECRRDRYRAFTDLWQQVHGKPDAGLAVPKAIDKALHAARISRGGGKATFEADVASLPGGTIFALNRSAVLVWNDRQFDWSLEGYSPRPEPASGIATVLTPRPVVEVLRQGFMPDIHPSALRPA